MFFFKINAIIIDNIMKWMANTIYGEDCNNTLFKIWSIIGIWIKQIVCINSDKFIRYIG